MMHADQPRPRSIAMEQRRSSSQWRRGRTQREALAERAIANETFEDRRDLPCVRLLRRAHCLLHQRPSE